MDLMKLIKGTDIGDCVARLLFTWNADHPDAEKAKETFISAIKSKNAAAGKAEFVECGKTFGQH